MQRTQVDKTICIGCGLCEAQCPRSYRLQDDLISEALPDQQDPVDMLDMSLEDCPVGAITPVNNE